MVALDRASPHPARQSEDSCHIRPAAHEITDEVEAVVRAEPNAIQKVVELCRAPMDISNDDGSRHRSNPK
jgi:hypothetical protein